MQGINLSEFYRVYEFARSIGNTDDRKLMWHIWEPMLKTDDDHGFFGLKTTPSPVKDNRLLGVKAILYPEHALGEVLGYPFLLENHISSEFFAIVNNKPTRLPKFTWSL